MRTQEFLKSAKGLSDEFKDIPTIWEGRKSILEMKESGFPHWK